MPHTALEDFPPLFWVALALCGLLLGGRVCRAGDPPLAAFRQGNALDGAGNYSAAAAAYEGAVRSGNCSANLFYNLGNTYARLGQRGRAALNYRRALILDPADAGARANLAALPGHPDAPDGSWLNRQTHLTDIDLWPIAAAIAGCLGLAAQCLGGGSTWRLPAVALGLGICLLAAGAAWRLEGGSKNAGRAIVAGEQSRVLDAPAANSKAITELPAGTELRVVSSQGAWVYAELADGSRGWLAADAVEKIVPPGYGSMK
jgi:tetratricopeptide (TPR) repeat protein